MFIDLCVAGVAASTILSRHANAAWLEDETILARSLRRASTYIYARPKPVMRIAFISYEYFGVAEGGGIGTYVRFASEMLAQRGHSVAVFTSAKNTHE